MSELLNSASISNLEAHRLIEKITITGRDNRYDLRELEVDLDSFGNVLLISSDRKNIPDMGITPFQISSHPTAENWVIYTENPKFILNRLILMGFALKKRKDESPAIVEFSKKFPFEIG
ncbi:hypothetical protein [Dyadobacter sp. NIV53]|uniref:hypothetical protein n=1 Tax=Dyadobacter sp. NIV53 TaxID=2861765 RepID=UPI001C8870E2|nr:hypothetical protein [Dyadobacter sp. NIV53]